MIEAMILQSKETKQLAGQAVRAMIRCGRSLSVVRTHKIPQDVYHLALGRAGRGIVESLAIEETRSIRQDYLDEKEAEEAEEALMQQMKTRGHDRWNVI